MEEMAQPTFKESRYAVGKVPASEEAFSPSTCKGSALLLHSETMI